MTNKILNNNGELNFVYLGTDGRLYTYNNANTVEVKTEPLIQDITDNSWVSQGTIKMLKGIDMVTINFNAVKFAGQTASSTYTKTYEELGIPRSAITTRVLSNSNATIDGDVTADNKGITVRTFTTGNSINCSLVYIIGNQLKAGDVYMKQGAFIAQEDLHESMAQDVLGFYVGSANGKHIVMDAQFSDEMIFGTGTFTERTIFDKGLSYLTVLKNSSNPNIMPELDEDVIMTQWHRAALELGMQDSIDEKGVYPVMDWSRERSSYTGLNMFVPNPRTLALYYLNKEAIQASRVKLGLSEYPNRLWNASTVGEAGQWFKAIDVSSVGSANSQVFIDTLQCRYAGASVQKAVDKLNTVLFFLV